MRNSILDALLVLAIGLPFCFLFDFAWFCFKNRAKKPRKEKGKMVGSISEAKRLRTVYSDFKSDAHMPPREMFH